MEERLKPLCLCADRTDFNPGDGIAWELRTAWASERRQRSHDLYRGLPDTLCSFSSGRALLESSRRSWSGPRPPLHPLPAVDHRKQRQNQTRFSPIKTSTVSTAENLPPCPFWKQGLSLHILQTFNLNCAVPHNWSY